MIGEASGEGGKRERLYLVTGAAGHLGGTLVRMNEEEVNKIAPQVTRIQIGDCMNRDVLAELGVRNFDVCFVCISDNFQSSMEITSQLKELGAACVVSKSDEDIHADLLKKIGADEVVYPERDMARRTAMMDFAFFAIAFNIGKMCKSTTLKEIRAAMEALMASFTRRCTLLGSLRRPSVTYGMRLAA